MSGMTSHAQGKSRTPGLGAAWAVLIGTGVTSVTYNVVHATRGAGLEVVLALLLGFAPAFVAAFLSHVAAVLEAPRWFIVSVVGVMGTGMVLSASATAAVVAPAEPGWRGWLFGGLLDAAALLALWAILTARGKKAAAEAAAAAGRSEAREALARAAAAEEELASVRAELSDQLDTVRAELETTREALVRAGTGAGKKRVRKSAPRPRRSGSATGSTEDLTTELRALQLLDENPELRRPRMGSELGRRLGVDPSYGRKLHRDLTAKDRPSEAGQERPGAAAQERPQERSEDR